MQAVARLTLSVPDDVATALNEVAALRASSKVDVIRRAIALERWLCDVTRDGSTLEIVAPDGTRREVVRF